MNGEWTFKDGVADGPAKQFFYGGELHQEGDFKNGKLNGIVREYYESGQIRMEYTSKDGVRVSKIKFWSREGKPTEKDTGGTLPDLFIFR